MKTSELGKWQDIADEAQRDVLYWKKLARQAQAERDDLRKNQLELCKQAGEYQDRITELADALYSMLNIENCALNGLAFEVNTGLDVAWHFTKARAALAKLEGK
jgi:hypothetical protein